MDHSAETYLQTVRAHLERERDRDRDLRDFKPLSTQPEGEDELDNQSRIVRYFQPARQESQFDKYGHAILPTRLREITDDAISAARLQFPKSQDEPFVGSPLEP